MINKIFFLFLLFFLFFQADLSLAENSKIMDAMKQYQHDMDIVRLNDLKEIGGYIEEYKSKIGKYPYEGQYEFPLNAVLATKEQKETFDKSRKPPHPHKNVFYNDFKKELEKGLGREIIIPFDPQRVPSGRQNFYVYMIDGANYFFAVHLYNSYPFSQKINKNWHKVEISNTSHPNVPIWNYNTLMGNEYFELAINEKLYKPDYIKYLREKIRAEVGF